MLVQSEETYTGLEAVLMIPVSAKVLRSHGERRP
jgi:hypothetical protein